MGESIPSINKLVAATLTAAMSSHKEGKERDANDLVAAYKEVLAALEASDKATLAPSAYEAGDLLILG